MLKEDLLLDSARPFSDENQDETYRGRQEMHIPGVPFLCLDPRQNYWYVLRVSYSRELKIKAMLEDRGVRTFVPMEWRKKEQNGKQVKVLVPAINNLCFVNSSKETLDDFIHAYGEDSPVHYYWDRTTRRPLTVRDKVMEAFITVSSAIDNDILYIREITPKLRAGASVKVKEGPFAGVEGKVVRIKKSRRIVVELPGMLAVATTYVAPEAIEILNP